MSNLRFSGATRATALVAIVLVLSACSNVVRLPDCIDCRPVEMAVDQVLEVELGSDRAIGNDPDAYEWVVANPGAMILVDEDRGRRSEDPDEFLGGYSTYVVFHFEPAAPGTTQMEFHCVTPDDPAAEPVNTLSITVNVDG